MDVEGPHPIRAHLPNDDFAGLRHPVHLLTAHLGRGGPPAPAHLHLHPFWDLSKSSTLYASVKLGVRPPRCTTAPLGHRSRVLIALRLGCSTCMSVSFYGQTADGKPIMLDIEH